MGEGGCDGAAGVAAETTGLRRMWLWWWPVAPGRVSKVPVMTSAGTSKVEARRRAREVTRRANEARAAREKANIENAATYMWPKPGWPKSTPGRLSGWWR